MKTKTIINLTPLLVMIILFCTSCDPGVTYNKIIQNDSEYDVVIYVHNGLSAYYEIDSIYIEKKSEGKIMSYGGLGQTTEFEDCDHFADSLTSQVISPDSLELKLNLNNQSNWQFTVLDKTFKSGGTCECTLVLSNVAIE